MSNYLQDAESDAKGTVDNFIDEIIEQLIDNGEASDDLNNDYANGDSYHHENHVDKWYSLTDACNVITELDEFEETDNGLWDGQPMKEALSTCAAFTYGNAVYSEWTDLIKDINDDAETILEEYTDEENDLEIDIADLKDRIKDAEDAEPDDAEYDSDKDLGKLQEELSEKEAKLESLPERREKALREMIEEKTS
ncbi:MAG: hypothetical protein ABFC88_13135 [Thermoguttaceae bacterium]